MRVARSRVPAGSARWTRQSWPTTAIVCGGLSRGLAAGAVRRRVRIIVGVASSSAAAAASGTAARDRPLTPSGGRRSPGRPDRAAPRRPRRRAPPRRRPARRPRGRGAPSRPGAGSRPAAAAGRRRARRGRRSGSGRSRRGRRGTRARPPAAGRSGRRGSARAARATRVVARALLDADRALGDRRQHLVRRRSAGAGRRSRPSRSQPGHGEEGRRRHAVVELAQPGLHAAAELDDLRGRGGGGSTWARAAQARGADDAARRQVRQRPPRRARRRRRATSSRGRQAGDGEAVGLQRRHVLHRVHGDVDRAGGQRLLDLAGEEALAAELGQGRSCTRSPVVRIATISKAASGRPCAAISRSRASCACASASGLPRVPIRSGRSGVGRSRASAAFLSGADL